MYEIGISYHGRTYQDGKKIGWRDGFRAVYAIFKYGLTVPRRRTSPTVVRPDVALALAGEKSA